MQLLLSSLYTAPPLHRLPACSISSSAFSQCRTASCSAELFATRWRRGLTGRTRLHTQSQEGVDGETINVTNLHNAAPWSSETPQPAPANPPYYAGLSEEEVQEALLFEEGKRILQLNPLNPKLVSKTLAGEV
jgi:hypothetical protein